MPTLPLRLRAFARSRHRVPRGSRAAGRARRVAAVSWHPVAAPGGLAATRRRRLWELSSRAHELILSLTFSPDALRKEVARALGKMHRARCHLGGSDADLLQALMHDVATRNPLSEALERRLDERHAGAVRRCAALRGVPALRAAWQAARDGGAPADAIWAVLTHREGGLLEDEVLREASQQVFGEARASRLRAAEQAHWQGRVQAADEALREARHRAMQAHRESEATIRSLREQLAAAVGEAARWRQRAESHSAEAASPSRAPGTAPPVGLPAEPRGPQPPQPRPPGGSPVPPQAAQAARATKVVAFAPACPPDLRPAGPGPAIEGRRVLCVGGIRRAVALYRSAVERLGAGFEHHDGGVEDGVTCLEGCLQRADLVICQAGCINHEAYQRIKRHCSRAGKPCVYLERPSLSHFGRALATLAQPAGALVAAGSSTQASRSLE